MEFEHRGKDGISPAKFAQVDKSLQDGFKRPPDAEMRHVLKRVYLGGLTTVEEVFKTQQELERYTKDNNLDMTLYETGVVPVVRRS